MKFQSPKDVLDSNWESLRIKDKEKGSLIGKNVNFGCGCITANFDGVNKHKTVIKDNTFVGCNTNIIAPLTIGNNCYIAAGTNVTEDVDDDTFVIGRSRMNKKNK